MFLDVFRTRFRPVFPKMVKRPDQTGLLNTRHRYRKGLSREVKQLEKDERALEKEWTYE
jgi:hypothetical protein